MAGASNELLEMILRECESSNNQPWYPSEYAKETGVARDRLDASLDDLRLGGLIQLTEWTKDKGQGYVLTAAGAEVLNSPRALNQLRRHGVPARARPEPQTPEYEEMEVPGWDRAKEIRNALITPMRPRVTLMLIYLNLINFVYGVVLASQAQVPLSDFLWFSQTPAVNQIRDDTGALVGKTSVLRGEWWRLVTCAFVHVGLAHLAMNMFVLFSIGPMLERMWGSGRFLILYMLTGVVASITAVVVNPQGGLAGASGAICGLIGSLLAWVWLNKKYLPNAADWMRNLMMNVFLIILISMIPGVSASAHFGGGIAGLILAVPLNFSRFGVGAQRTAAWVGVVVLALGVVGFVYLQLSSELERARAYLPLIDEVSKVSQDADTEHVEPFLSELDEKKKISKATKNETFAAITDVLTILKVKENKIEAAAGYQDPRINTAMDAAKGYIDKWQLYFRTVKKSVDDEGNLVPAERTKLRGILREAFQLHKQIADSILVTQQNGQK